MTQDGSLWNSTHHAQPDLGKLRTLWISKRYYMLLRTYNYSFSLKSLVASYHGMIL